MSAKVTDPYNVFYDLDGEALEAGYIYIGTSGLDPVSNPIPVYWDAALTVVASQPVRTIAGRPANAGSQIGALYTVNEYSLLIQDSQEQTVISELNAIGDFLLGSELDMGGEKVTNLGAGTNPGDAVRLDQITVTDSADRNFENATAGKAYGGVFLMAGLSYIADATGTATDDLGVSGISPSGGVAYPEHFGCTAGAGDNGQKLDRAVDWGRDNETPIYGRGKIYPITTAMTAVPFVVDLVIDASGLTATYAWSANAADYEASKSLASNTLQGDRTFSVTAHGYSVGDVVLITSDKVFETGTNARCAHWGRISDATVDTFTTNEAALCNLKTTENAIVRRLPSSNAARVNLRMIGGANCGNGFRAIRFTDLQLHFESVGFADRSATITETYATYVEYCSASDSDTAGLGYGLAAAGNGWLRADYVYGRRTRHAITFGASGTIPSVGGTVGDVVGHECLSAAFDTHPASLNVIQTGKTVCDMSGQLATEDGMVWQSVGGEFDVTFFGEAASRHGVLLQPVHDMTAFEFPPSYHFKARGISATSRGVAMDFDLCGDIDTITCEAYGKSVNTFIDVDMGTGALEALKLSGKGTSENARGVFVQCEPTSDLGFVTTSGEWRAGASECLYILGATDAGSRTTQWAVSMAKASGGTIGLRAANKVEAVAGVAFLDGSSLATQATGVATVTVL